MSNHLQKAEQNIIQSLVQSGAKIGGPLLERIERTEGLGAHFRKRVPIKRIFNACHLLPHEGVWGGSACDYATWVVKKAAVHAGKTGHDEVTGPEFYAMVDAGRKAGLYSKPEDGRNGLDDEISNAKAAFLLAAMKESAWDYLDANPNIDFDTWQWHCGGSDDQADCKIDN